VAVSADIFSLLPKKIFTPHTNIFALHVPFFARRDFGGPKNADRKARWRD
jgi:hypothetical protein